MSNEKLYPCFVPSLVSILLNREKKLARPLTETEVYKILDSCNVMMNPISMKLKMDESRGSEDINPENCWNEWQQVRIELSEDDEMEG